MDAVLTRMIKGLKGYKLGGEVKKIMFIFIRIEEIKSVMTKVYKIQKVLKKKNDATRIFRRETGKTG